MLKIKLTRLGKRNQPHYRIVVNEARDKRDGSYVAKLGHYIPTQVPKVLVLDTKAYDEWLKNGAQPTETVSRLAEIAKAGKGFPPKKASKSKKAKAKLEKKTEDSAPSSTTNESPEAVAAPVETTASPSPEVEVSAN